MSAAERARLGGEARGQEEPVTLYLIDGYAQFFRAYHAIRTPMTSPVTKEPTNMTFGFLGMLLKLLRGEGKIGKKVDGGGGAAYVAVCLDVSGDKGTFRSQVYPEYKAHRTEPPSDLGVQVERCLGTLRELGVPIVGAAGYEADDCIAAIVERMRKMRPEVRVRIISKDKDLKQLLEEGSVELYDIHTDELMTEGTLKAETGLEPGQVVEMLTLMGDNVDNVPGVEGVGPKTAAKLIGEYGTAEGVLDAAAAGKIKGKLGERLKEAAEDRSKLRLSHELVTLRRDVPIEFDLESAGTERIRLERLIPVLKELGFNRYQDETRMLLGEKSGSAEQKKKDDAGARSGADKGAAGKKKGSTDDPTGFVTLFDSAGERGGSGSVRAGLEGVKAQAGEYRCLRTEEELREFVRAAQRVLEDDEGAVLAIDTETTGLSPLECELCGVSMSVEEGKGVYVPIRSPESERHMDEERVLEILRPMFEDARVGKCGHNLKFDVLVLRKAGVRVAGFGFDRDAEGSSRIFDSMVASYVIDATRSSHGLDALALALLGRTNISIKELIGAKGAGQGRFDDVPLDAATEYAAEDADVALQLRGKMRGQLEEMGLRELFERVEMPLVEVLAELEYNGIRVDRGELEQQRGKLAERIEGLRKKINESAMETIGRTFNPDSPRQLAAVLFNRPDAEVDPDDPVSSGPGLGLMPVKRIKTGYSTDAEVLETLAQDPEVKTPIPGLIVEYRELAKLVNTYLVALAEAINAKTGRVHSSFSQTVAVTGRLASSDPNLQNIPIRTEIGKEIRRAFVAEKGKVLISADYSQIELRLLAHLSRDPNLIEAFLQGEDIHTTVAAQIAGIKPSEVSKQQRSAAKMVNFGIVYGITPYGLARRLGCGNAQAAEIIDGYKRRFAGITTFLQECVEMAKSKGYVETMLGRRRAIPDIHSNVPARRSLAERTAINTVVQGSAADLIKLAMIDIHREIVGRRGVAEGLKMLLQIHDELVFECEKDRAEAARRMIVEKMENAAGTWPGLRLSVPIRVDASIAENWYEGK